ncbi:hypothetical protein [Nocardia ninae]|uniref:hypothetical protein n=1 Tax=Nocardia ninae TaxID=356145 RepID=UPI0011BF4530|nr:hypothetical protein [Nocardia ninae]
MARDPDTIPGPVIVIPQVPPPLPPSLEEIIKDALDGIGKMLEEIGKLPKKLLLRAVIELLRLLEMLRELFGPAEPNDNSIAPPNPMRQPPPLTIPTPPRTATPAPPTPTPTPTPTRPLEIEPTLPSKPPAQPEPSPAPTPLPEPTPPPQIEPTLPPEPIHPPDVEPEPQVAPGPLPDTLPALPPEVQPNLPPEVVPARPPEISPPDPDVSAEPDPQPHPDVAAPPDGPSLPAEPDAPYVFPPRAEQSEPPAAEGNDAESPSEPAGGLDAMPTVRELLDTNEDELLEILRRGMQGEYGRPDKETGKRLRLQIDYVEVVTDEQTGKPMIIVYATVRDRNGTEVGQVTRVFTEDKWGDLVVTNSWFHLDENMRGGGFSTDLSPKLEAYYRRSGVTEIIVEASMKDGGWAWAKAGFDWDNTGPDKEQQNRASMLNQIRAVRDDPDLSASDQALLDELAASFTGPSDGWPSPMSVKDMQSENSALSERILRGSHWYGVKWL